MIRALLGFLGGGAALFLALVVTVILGFGIPKPPAITVEGLEHSLNQPRSVQLGPR